MPRQIKSCEEDDVHGKPNARRFYPWTQRPGATARVKRRTNRRERREGKKQTREQ